MQSVGWKVKLNITQHNKGMEAEKELVETAGLSPLDLLADWPGKAIYSLLGAPGPGALQ